VPGRVNVLSTQNVEYQLARNLAKAYGGRRRLFTALDWRKMAREESRTWRAMSLVLAVSEVDAQVMRDAGAREVIVCPNGTDAVAPLPPPRRRPGEPLRVMFLGSGHYRPNDLGLRWFVEEVLPVVREQVEVEFLVVGDPPPNRPEADGVRYVGRVATVTPWYEQCHAVVVPLLQSGGTRLKIIEAIAHGRPVVSTGVGAEGLPLTAGVHYLRADDPEAFARALAHLASQAESDGQGTRALLDAARTAIAELLWPNIVDKLTVTYRSLLRT
jgi:glycosyltransferase involved in cell wall biosynthesis